MLKTKRILLFLLLLMIIAGTMTGCNVKKTKSFQCVEDFEQARIGILTGSSHDNTAKELFPNASRVYFNNMSDMILAVEHEEFGRKNRISQRTIYNIQAYIEEMCVQIILPQMKAPFETLVTIEYSEEKDNADVVVRYSGESFDPLQTDNELSMLLVKKAADSIGYNFEPGQELRNKVDAKIR